LPNTRHLPSLSFFPTSTAYSATALQVYCTLLPAMRFELFPTMCPFCRSSRQSIHFAFPRLALHTLQSFSLVSSRTASPQPLPSRRYLHGCFQFVLARPQGFALLSSPLSPFVFPLPLTRCSLGLRSPSRLSPWLRCSCRSLLNLFIETNMLQASVAETTSR
jgi:hypothetical protein